MTQKSEESRGVWLVRWWSDLAQDLRYSFRGMRRDAGFTAFAILIAGLGIGASSTVFSVVNALLLRPAPVSRSGPPGLDCERGNGSTQVTNFLDLREQNRSFSDLAGWFGGYGRRRLATDGNGRAGTSDGRSRDAELLPAAGRGTGARQIVHRGRMSGRGAYAPPAVLLSYGFWQRRFASDPSVVGRKLTVQQSPRDRGGRAACFLRLRCSVRARHAGGYLHPLAADGQKRTGAATP